jgi:hypothetical protein
MPRNIPGRIGRQAPGDLQRARRFAEVKKSARFGIVELRPGKSGGACPGVALERLGGVT